MQLDKMKGTVPTKGKGAMDMEWKGDRSYLMSLRGGFLMPTTARVKPQLGVRLKAFRCRN